MADTQERKLVLIMFTDMVGYSALAQRDEKLSLELLEEHRRLLRSIFPRHGGKEIKTIGDAFLVEFTSAVQAAACAIEIQKTLAQHNLTAPEPRRIQVRIGLHVGDVIFQENDVYGDGVNIAARIEPLAEPGGICVSEDVARQIHNKIEFALEKLGPRELKNIKLPMEIHRIVLPWAAPSQPAAAPPPRGLRVRRTHAVALGAVLLVVLAGLSGWWLRRRAGSPAPVTPTIQSLAVLPLQNLSRDPEQEYFADGMTEELIADLGKISALRVISRTSVMQYKAAKKPLPEIARELNVDAVVEGSVRRSGDRVRITVQLIHASTDRHLWAESYERNLRDVLALQEELARTIASEIRIRVTPQEQARLATARPVNPEAYEAYLKGRYYLFHGSTDEDNSKISDYARQAIEIDPTYAPAYALLADFYFGSSIMGWLPRSEGYAKAKAAALKALELDDTLAEAHVSLAQLKFYEEFDWSGAEREYRRALELNPHSVDALLSYAGLLSMTGRFDEAIATDKRAVELDPLTPLTTHNLGLICFIARRYDDSIRQLRRALELGPKFHPARVVLAWNYAMKGMHREAVSTCQEVTPFFMEDQWALASCAWVYALAGRRAEALRLLEHLKRTPAIKWVDPGLIAFIYGGLGDEERAIEWMEKAYQERSHLLPFLILFPAFDPLRSDPRFQDLVRRMNFPE